jgi:DNA polymerase-3 subunit alpha
VLDGQCAISKIFEKAQADGMPAMAVTDHGNMFGIKEFFDVANKKNAGWAKEGKPTVKPIFGCEVYVARRGMNIKEKGNRIDQSGWHLILLAKNLHGYKNLIKMVSLGWTDGFFSRPRIDHEVLEKYHEDVICCSACIGGEVPQKILQGDLKGAEDAVLWHKKLFGDDYYLELQRHETHAENARQDTFPLQQEANAVLIELARKHNIKLICTNDVHFVDEDNAEAHDHLICLNTGKDLNDPNRMRYTKQEWFKTTAEMNAIFADVPEALRNTVELAEKVETYNIENPPIMPNFEIPADFGTEEEYRQRITEQDLFDEFTRDENGQVVLEEEAAKAKIKKLGGYDKLYRIKLEADYLRKLTMEGAHRLYGDPLSQEVDDRIRFELHIMKTMGFPGYFLIVQDFINASRKELGVSVGPGRGSAAGSVVAYCLGITKIDPIKYDLLFERFLNPDRISLPDIDTDFDDDGRGRVLEWVQHKYGADKVAHIITYSTMATKMVIKDVARVEKLSIAESNRLVSYIPDRLPEVDGKAPKINLKNCIRAVPELQDAVDSPDPVIHNVMKYAQMLEGNIRGTGVHACGVIIGRDPITDVVPVSVAEDKTTGAKLLVTQYEGSVIESTGLIKMDFLGLKTLSIINEAVDNIRQSRGIEVDVDTIPIDDPLTYKLYCEGRTIGTFQFESPGMQKYLRELQPGVFEDLIAMNALYRPGPMDYIPDFIDRKLGRKPVVYDIPCMEKYLKDTYGVTVYQEQVMLLSRQLANFTRGESDALRKAMGKKLREKLDHMKPQFISQGQANGHDPKTLEKIWADWEKFASYAFNKSHATCYSWVAYQTAYLKAHYGAEYMAAVLSRNLNNITELAKYMDECKAMGLVVKGPDVNLSRLKYSVDKEGAVRYGLAGVKSVGEGAALAIIEEREKNGPYTDIFNFIERVNLLSVNKKAVEALALSGAFDSFPEAKREQYVSNLPNGENFLDALMRYGQRYRADKEMNTNSLFGDAEDCVIEIAHPAFPEFESMGTLSRLNREKEFVGVYLSAHPLDDYRLQLKYACNTQMTDFDADPMTLQGREITCGGIVTSWREGISKKGNPYGILKVSDYSGAHEFPLFGPDFPAWRGYGKEGMYLIIHGQYQPKRFVRDVKSADDLQFKILKIEQLNEVADQLLDSLTVIVDHSQLNHGTMHLLQAELSNASAVDNRPDESGQINKPRTDLFFEFVDEAKKYHVNMYSRKQKVRITNELISFLTQQDGMACKINGHPVNLKEEQTKTTEEEEVVPNPADLVDDNA